MTHQELKAEFNVPLTLSDGTILRNDIFSPTAAGKFPVIVLRVPYDKSFYYNLGFVKPYEFAKQGFIVVVQDVRGRFESEGEFVPAVNEGPDGYETVEWAARLPGSNGKVGMYGDSYVAESQWSAAFEKPPSLHAIIPGVSPSWSAHDGFFTRGGVHEIGCRFTWVFGALSPDYIRREYAGGDRIKALKLFSEEAGYFTESVAFQSRTLDKYSDSKSYVPIGMESTGWPLADARHELNRTRGRHNDLELPIFMTGGWFDVFLGSTIKQYRASLEASKAKGTKSPRLVIGPWSHIDFSGSGSGQNFGPSSSSETVNGESSLFDLCVDWFNSTLKGQESIVKDDSAVKVFITGKNKWIALGEFPFGFEKSKPWFLGEKGQLNQQVPAENSTVGYVFDPRNPVPTLGGQTLIAPSMVGPLDQTPLYARADIISFTGEPLDEATTCLGQVAATLYVSTDAKDTDFIVRITDIAPDGTSRVLADSIMRCKYRENFDYDGWRGTFKESAPLQGEVVELNMDLWVMGHTFEKGHRIGVDITSSSSPRWHVNGNTGHDAWENDEMVTANQKIHLGPEYPSRIILPFVSESALGKFSD